MKFAVDIRAVSAIIIGRKTIEPAGTKEMNDKQDKPKSMAEIAEMLGITTTSVSLALRNSTLISSKLRNQVQKVAEECGFKARTLPETAERGGNGRAARGEDHGSVRPGRFGRPGRAADHEQRHETADRAQSAVRTLFLRRSV